MVTCREAVARFVSHAGVPARPDTADGFLAGDPNRVVDGIAVTGMATLEVLHQAAARGMNLVVTHEPLYYDHRNRQERYLTETADPVYAVKSAFVAANRLTVWHLHDLCHDTGPDAVDHSLARALGWQPCERTEMAGAYSIDPPMALGTLAARAARITGARAARYIGDPEQPVRTVALNVGFRGFEINRRSLSHPDIDALLIGEGHEWESGEYAADAVTAGFRKGMIVLGHLPSEQLAMADAAQSLASLVPEIPVRYLPAEDPYAAVGPSV
ncbi:MAG TPA: Nif3-like dinuclear metal center hexameric protein [Cellulomonas sp.]